MTDEEAEVVYKEAQQKADEIYKEYEQYFQCWNCRTYNSKTGYCKFLKCKVSPQSLCEEFDCKNDKEKGYFEKVNPYFTIMGTFPEDLK